MRCSVADKSTDVVATTMFDGDDALARFSGAVALLAVARFRWDGAAVRSESASIGVDADREEG